MYILPIPFGTPAFDENIRLRHDILRAPLGISFEAQDIAEEWTSTHLGCYDESGTLMGSLIMKPLSSEEVKMRQVAVAEKHQNKGVGQKMVAASEVWAKVNGFAEITLHAREVAAPFYDKLNYERIGERFEEVNIPHFKMRKKL